MGKVVNILGRQVQLLNSAGVLRIRELRNEARILIPAVTWEQQRSYMDKMDNARQISLNCEFLLDMLGVDPLPSVSVEVKPEPKGIA